MKYYTALLVVALAAALVPSSEGLESLRANTPQLTARASVLSKGNGSTKGPKGGSSKAPKGPKSTKGPKSGSKSDTHPLEFYAPAHGGTAFNLADDCPDGTLCVGTILTFKEPVYIDDVFKYEAGYLIGECTVVSVEDVVVSVAEPEVEKILCCVSTLVLDYEDVYHGPFKAEIAMQGSSIVGTGGNFLITAAGGKFKGEKGIVENRSLERLEEKYTSLKVEFY